MLTIKKAVNILSKAVSNVPRPNGKVKEKRTRASTLVVSFSLQLPLFLVLLLVSAITVVTVKVAYFLDFLRRVPYRHPPRILVLDKPPQITINPWHLLRVLVHLIVLVAVWVAHDLV